MDEIKNKHGKPDNIPVTLGEINKDINDRIERITDEFKMGFNFIKDCEKSVTFFGSARTSEHESDYILARSLANRIAKETDYAVITGGSFGIMEAANRGAFEAGGKSLGLNIKLPEEQDANPYLTGGIDFNYFFTRKVCLTFSAEAYIYLPGGFGTLDELFEILTLIQTNKIEKRPVILFGKGYWDSLDEFIRNTLLKDEKISVEDLDLYTITDNEDEVIEIIRQAPIRVT